MKKGGSNSLKLAVITVTAVLVLGLANLFLQPVIEKRKARDFRDTLASLAKGGTPGEEKLVKDAFPVKAIYPVKDKNGKVSAYVLGLAGKGHGGEMKLLAGYKTDGEVLGVRLLEHSETPGLGAKAESADYMKKYLGKGTAKPIPVRKNQLPPVDDVSGATLTFVGVGKALEGGSEYVKNLGGAK